MSPKIKVPAHIMKQHTKDQEALKKGNQELRQAIAEHDVKVSTQHRKQQEADHKQRLQKRIADTATEGKAANDEIKELKDEGYAYSLQLAKQRIKSRVEVLTLDRTFYQGEIKKFQDKELSAGFLEDELDKIETELTELSG